LKQNLYRSYRRADRVRLAPKLIKKFPPLQEFPSKININIEKKHEITENMAMVIIFNMFFAAVPVLQHK
jgi:hypothetical protein